MMESLPAPPAATPRSESDFQNWKSVKKHRSPAFRDVPSNERRGHSCFGCLCDMRRAVIACNAVSLVFALVEIVAAITLLALYEELETKNDDQDGTVGASSVEWFRFNNHEMSKTILGIALGFGLLSTVFFSLGIRGAKQYDTSLVGSALFYYCVNVIANLILLSPLGVLFAGLAVYPHIMLYLELRNGIMSEENYINERNTCCLV
ncbi:expressed unknown protein [Seminavis robusta]|uniref:Uncharacterized protein n=1 Tax=Seminavis robusta TaxID=568900 RepID=A0A9N8DL67_9STRA|nr:expressed unknown protein [Seminavis robusta]|eukprot:Sro117_g057470.1 n/a (206) ;mRNA; f:90321-90938